MLVVTLHEDGGEFLDDFLSGIHSNFGRLGAKNQHVVIFSQQATAMHSFGSFDKLFRLLALLVVLVVL